MRKTISEKITELEQRENIRIIHAVESGSRAWGFASPDSDYDVRFIYARPKNFYLRLDRGRDVIEWQLDETLDINGWDIKKALRLLHASNPTLFEWNNSPIVYKTTDIWSEISTEINDYFSVKAGLYHYLNMASGNYREYLKSDTVRLKKYFYVIRPLLACKWIMDRKCPPPMLFAELVEEELESDIKPIVYDLLKVKMNTPEVGEGARIDKLNEYIEYNLTKLMTEVSNLPREPRASWDRLNELFLSVISEHHQKY